MLCPRCRQPLLKKVSSAGAFFECPSCRGRAINWAVVRKRVRKEAVRKIWQEVREKAAPSALACPACRRNMSVVAVGVGKHSVEIDLCQRCLLAWFDAGELQSLPLRETSPALQREFPPEVKEKLALLELERMRRLEKQEVAGDEIPENPLHWLIGVLGLPVEVDAPAVRCRPWITWGLAAACIAIFFATWHDTLGFAEAFGIIPADLFRLGGLTIFSAFFLHADIWHLLGNVYFLLVFGDNTEDQLGRLPYLGLLVLGQLFGALFHAVIAPHATVPCIGASAAVSAMVVFYALSFPNAGIAVMWRHYLFFRWLRFPAVVGLILWTVLQVVLAALQVQDLTDVSAASHLGGALVGLVIWTIHRLQRGGGDFLTTVPSP